MPRCAPQPRRSHTVSCFTTGDSILFYSIQPADTLSLLPRSLLGLARRLRSPLVVFEPELPRDRATLFLLVGGQVLEDDSQIILQSSERASGLEMQVAGWLAG